MIDDQATVDASAMASLASFAIPLRITHSALGQNPGHLKIRCC